ncbi:MAG: DNA primase, partial [Sphaerospermopsis kisseleviana]
HYYLTHESEYFHGRDQEEWQKQLSWGEGKVFLPDIKTYTLKVEAMRALGMLQFLESGRVFSENDSDIIWLKNVAIHSSKHIKRALGIDVVKEKKSVSGITILNRLLSLLGLKLQQANNVDKGVDKVYKVYKVYKV